MLCEDGSRNEFCAYYLLDKISRFELIMVLEASRNSLFSLTVDSNGIWYYSRTRVGDYPWLGVRAVSAVVESTLRRELERRLLRRRLRSVKFSSMSSLRTLPSSSLSSSFFFLERRTDATMMRMMQRRRIKTQMAENAITIHLCELSLSPLSFPALSSDLTTFVA